MCNCIQEQNEILDDYEPGRSLVTLFLSSGSHGGGQRQTIEIRTHNDTPIKGRSKYRWLIPLFCPLCGERYKTLDEIEAERKEANP